jgi:hypothetical protein
MFVVRIDRVERWHAVAEATNGFKERTAEKLVGIRVEAPWAPLVLLMHDVVGGLRDCEPEDYRLADWCGRMKRPDGGSRLE